MRKIFKEFVCYGNFYDVNLNKSKKVKCRNILDIYRKGYYKKDAKIKLDAIAIMMNPGTSRPINSIPSVLKVPFNKNQILNSVKMVLTNPDTTQAKLMKIMKEKNWNYIRVINLSDIRQKDNSKLKGEIKSYNIEVQKNYENIYQDFHSIFCKDRRAELLEILGDENVPIIIGWGVRDCIEDYAKECLTVLNERHIVGDFPENQSVFCYHPLVRLKGHSWHKAIMNQL